MHHLDSKGVTWAICVNIVFSFALRCLFMMRPRPLPLGATSPIALVWIWRRNRCLHLLAAVLAEKM